MTNEFPRDVEQFNKDLQALSTWRKGKHRHPERGMIYFVEAVGLDRIKIGYTTGMFQARLAVIQTGSPVEIRPLMVMKDRSKLEEAVLHREFVQWRTHGEWYKLTKPIAEWLFAAWKDTDLDHVVSWRNNLEAIWRHHQIIS
jgi:hypothetical protein